VRQPGHVDNAKLAFFCGGLVGRKNVLAIMTHSSVSMG
jgi:ammonia channel protein AmtB